MWNNFVTVNSIGPKITSINQSLPVAVTKSYELPQDVLKIVFVLVMLMMNRWKYFDARSKYGELVSMIKNKWAF